MERAVPARFRRRTLDGINDSFGLRRFLTRRDGAFHPQIELGVGDGGRGERVACLLFDADVFEDDGVAIRDVGSRLTGESNVAESEVIDGHLGQAAEDDVNKPFTTANYWDQVEDERAYVEERATFLTEWLSCWQTGGTDIDGDGLCDPP